VPGLLALPRRGSGTGLPVGVVRDRSAAGPFRLLVTGRRLEKHDLCSSPAAAPSRHGAPPLDIPYPPGLPGRSSSTLGPGS
jgi:hypothetical protein